VVYYDGEILQSFDWSSLSEPARARLVADVNRVQGDYHIDDLRVLNDPNNDVAIDTQAMMSNMLSYAMPLSMAEKIDKLQEDIGILKDKLEDIIDMLESAMPKLSDKEADWMRKSLDEDSAHEW